MMYTYMARCEELNTKMKEMQPVAEQMYPLLVISASIRKCSSSLNHKRDNDSQGHMVITPN